MSQFLVFISFDVSISCIEVVVYYFVLILIGISFYWSFGLVAFYFYTKLLNHKIKVTEILKDTDNF